MTSRNGLSPGTALHFPVSTAVNSKQQVPRCNSLGRCKIASRDFFCAAATVQESCGTFCSNLRHPQL